MLLKKFTSQLQIFHIVLLSVNYSQNLQRNLCKVKMASQCYHILCDILLEELSPRYGVLGDVLSFEQ